MSQRRVAPVRRSKPQRKADYKQSLRRDFRFTCAYCSLAEAEATGVRFEIEHYMPQQGRWKGTEAAWLHAYDNLMWACEVCNNAKDDWEPTENDACKGIRLLKVDEDVPGEHLRLAGDLLEAKTSIGATTIDELCLNDRAALKALRRKRRELWGCDEVVFRGLAELLDEPLDSLPQRKQLEVRRVLENLVVQVAGSTEAAEDDESLLLAALRSPHLDDDPAFRAAKKARNELRAKSKPTAAKRGTKRKR